MSASELTQLMESRAAMYNLLSRAYAREVNQDFLDVLKAMRYPQGTGNEAIDDAYRRLHAFMCHVRESTLDALAVDYARCFLGSGSVDAMAAYPFESVYTSPKGLMMQDARDQVLAIYRSVGVGKSLTWRESEDHLAAELEFMKILCLRAMEALGEGDEGYATSMLLTQRNFLTDHILNWTPKFYADVDRFAKTDFYPAFTDLLEAFLQEDLALLEELVGSDDCAEEGDHA